MVVADHPDGFGLFPRLIAGDRELLAHPQVRQWYETIELGNGAEVANRIVTAQASGIIAKVVLSECFNSSRPGYRLAWYEVIKAAD